ncbi:RNA-binding protein MEX3A [Meleagris gallopavo]|uniref:Mex-3 RNA binding family member A n=1 Tax=Meleagris gallopavo TaxID=9103 RepID=H9H1Z9_MELGA|nr:RNA-binding protein MEX3A [Meleagris gallopavo]
MVWWEGTLVSSGVLYGLVGGDTVSSGVLYGLVGGDTVSSGVLYGVVGGDTLCVEGSAQNGSAFWGLWGWRWENLPPTFGDVFCCRQSPIGVRGTETSLPCSVPLGRGWFMLFPIAEGWHWCGLPDPSFLFSSLLQGCKIKALRAKTNTYIKTPVRGEEPVFMVTGRREDVAMARREIISAAEHFSMIRASRNKAGTTFGSAPTLPGQVTIRVRVPYRVVGLVVGPKGATIKRIQQQTNTYIITPSRDRDPVFEITGAPGNVERAREEIETHIAVRTGKILEYNNENDFLSSSPDSSMENRYSEAWRVHTPAPGCKPLSTFRQNSLGCIGDCSVDPVYETPRLNDQNDFNYGYLFPNYGVNKQDLYYGVPESGAPMWAGQENANPVSVLFSKQQRSSSTGAIHPNSHRSPSSSIQEPNLSALPRRSQGEPLQGFSKLGSTAAARTSVSSSRECMVCFESEVTAALVPCGHNLFCMECAVRICERTDPECPVCHAAATQAIRIFS